MEDKQKEAEEAEKSTGQRRERFPRSPTFPVDTRVDD